MKITICGSLAFEKTMQAAQLTLEKMGYETAVPVSAENANTDPLTRKRLIDDYFVEIDTSDAILVINETKNGVDNYIGGNTLIEMARAYAQGLEVFLLHPIPEMSYTIEIEAMQPIVIDGDMQNIDTYVSSLPLAYMSTESPVKHLAVSRGLRRAGIRVRVDGAKVESGVNEQPMTVAETYDGAMTRHDNLKHLDIKADYYITIESGQHPIHKNHNLFGCGVFIIEKTGQTPKVGIDVDIEFPQEMLDMVPSKYPDFGVLVQQEYGSKHKDPYPYFTNNKINRAQLLENAIYNVAVQLEESDDSSRVN